MTNIRKADIAAEFGKNVRTVRGFFGITMTELASRVGLTQAAISQFESGRRLPSLLNAVRISRGLGVKLSRLLGEK